MGAGSEPVSLRPDPGCKGRRNLPACGGGPVPKRAADLRRDNPVTHCLPAGPSAIFASGSTRLYRIIQSPKVIGLLYELSGFRQIYMDGRELPKDPNPTWMGYSVGHWEGDTLVVE